MAIHTTAVPVTAIAGIISRVLSVLLIAHAHTRTAVRAYAIINIAVVATPPLADAGAQIAPAAQTRIAILNNAIRLGRMVFLSQELPLLTGLSTKTVFTLQHLHQKVNTSQLSVK